MLKLNNLDRNIFAVNGADDTEGTISRNKLVASGRLLASEYIGKMVGGKEFNSRLAEIGGDYASMSKGHMEKKLLFCAAKAYKAVGKDAPTDVEAVKNDISLYKDRTFLRAMSSIDEEVITPLLYSVMSDLGGNMLNLRTAPVGRTTEITIHSNEAFVWEDGAFGSANSGTKNYLYDDVVTLNPKMYTCNGTIKWSQMVGIENGLDAGYYYTAIMRGLWSKITALYTNALLGAVSNTQYIPSYLSFSSYNSANWASATTAVAVANGVSRDQLMAFGNYASLQKILPNGTATDAALTYGLGEEWLKNGFVSMVGRVPLYEIMPAMIPNTVNTTGDMITLNNNVFITARVGGSYAPIHGVMADGFPVTMEYTPSQTADFELDIRMGALMDFKAVFPTKIAVIKNVI